MLVRALREAGHSVEEANDGRSGMRLFRRDPPQLVITDLVMSEQEGISTIMEIRREFATTPIIAISGGNRNPALYISTARKLGASAALEKPFSVDRFIAEVRRVLDS